jgi:hypothetical protein
MRGNLLDDVSHLGHEAFDLGNRPGGKSDELFAQHHDATAQRFFQGDFQVQVADAGDRQILVQDRLAAALPYRLEGLVKRRRVLLEPVGQGERRDGCDRASAKDFGGI